MSASPFDITAKSKIADSVCDIRVDPDKVAHLLSLSDLKTQERIYELSMAFIRELSIQADVGAYVNGNMHIANQAREIQQILLTYNTPQE